MKYFKIFWVLIIFLILVHTENYSQKSLKRISPWEVEATYSYWFYEKTDFGYNSYCIEKWQIHFQNNSSYLVTKIKFKLIIKTNDGVVLYKKVHSVDLEIEPGETVASDVFPLKNLVCADFPFDSDNFYWNIEILKVN